MLRTASSFAPYRSQQPLAVSRSLCNSSFSAKITLGCKRPPGGSLSLPTFADLRATARAVPTGVQTELRAEPSLPLTRKVARRRRDGRRERNKYQIFVISPSVIFQKKNDSSLVRGSLCLQYGLKRRTKSTITIKLYFISYRRGDLRSSINFSRN